jgi:histone H3/H4
MALINKSKVKEKTELQVSEEFYKELEIQTEELIKKAEKRARENSRRTLLARDL